MLELTCPHCQRSIELPEERRGRPSRCPKCGEAFRAPLYDGDAPESAPAKGAGWADAVAIAAAALGVAGVLAVAGLLLMQHYGRGLPVSRDLLKFSVALPLAVVLASWLAAKKAGNFYLVLTARFAGYLWLLGLVVLMIYAR